MTSNLARLLTERWECPDIAHRNGRLAMTLTDAVATAALIKHYVTVVPG